MNYSKTSKILFTATVLSLGIAAENLNAQGHPEVGSFFIGGVITGLVLYIWRPRNDTTIRK